MCSLKVDCHLTMCGIVHRAVVHAYMLYLSAAKGTQVVLELKDHCCARHSIMAGSSHSQRLCCLVCYLDFTLVDTYPQLCGI